MVGSNSRRLRIYVQLLAISKRLPCSDLMSYFPATWSLLNDCKGKESTKVLITDSELCDSGS